MSTDKRAFVERMDVTNPQAPTLSHARGYACAEMIVFAAIVTCGLLSVLACNAAFSILLPPGW